ncbi:hypothetical protein, unlikely [Trypanosoma brucei gambiense DAL972]|uniref:Uncharacterized protein n=1 Tax=Trypanosoma brucei gambiense (strain MHOM/CI/86/DAL972) TaxID=679716 RepID=C9ZU53_TRYB9|nr:hypothetical protein, unlikely [Trypanosoma brucei gambiense DAL972]CBH12939.1 hypothetical protein, unlikely [Trypanosoma brucei gambiense DAL972]|eukprot:XP_011775218.1 hypothetical protein, unlikely [Trypanosoma brucei gambiense DAL972]
MNIYIYIYIWNTLYMYTIFSPIPSLFAFCFYGHPVLGLVSGLEAFSREPPCGSVGALALRQTPETRGTAWEFLSYYPILPSRCLRDPFTILQTHIHVYNSII